MTKRHGPPAAPPGASDADEPAQPLAGQRVGDVSGGKANMAGRDLYDATNQFFGPTITIAPSAEALAAIWNNAITGHNAIGTVSGNAHVAQIGRDQINLNVLPDELVRLVRDGMSKPPRKQPAESEELESRRRKFRALAPRTQVDVISGQASRWLVANGFLRALYPRVAIASQAYVRNFGGRRVEVALAYTLTATHRLLHGIEVWGPWSVIDPSRTDPQELHFVVASLGSVPRGRVTKALPGFRFVDNTTLVGDAIERFHSETIVYAHLIAGINSEVEFIAKFQAQLMALGLDGDRSWPTVLWQKGPIPDWEDELELQEQLSLLLDPRAISSPASTGGGSGSRWRTVGTAGYRSSRVETIEIENSIRIVSRKAATKREWSAYEKGQTSDSLDSPQGERGRYARLLSNGYVVEFEPSREPPSKPARAGRSS